MRKLTFKLVRELFDYDYENGWLLRKFKNGKTKVCGDSPKSNGYAGMVSICGCPYLIHHVIWFWHKGTWPEHEIDHVDRNPMNNRIENLRDVSRAENMHNLGMNSHNTSGFRGVSFDGWKYCAMITVNSEHIYLGRFNTAEEAFLAYMVAKIHHHPTSPISQQYLRELTMVG